MSKEVRYRCIRCYETFSREPMIGRCPFCGVTIDEVEEGNDKVEHMMLTKYGRIWIPLTTMKSVRKAWMKSKGLPQQRTTLKEFLKCAQS